MKGKESFAERCFSYISVIILVLMSLFMIYPFYYLLIFSLNDPVDAMRGGIYLWPRKFSLMSYQTVIMTQNIGPAALMSLLRTVGGTITSVFCTAVLAYVLSKPYLLWRKFFNQFFIITMYISGGMIPTYMVMKWTGLTNNFFVYIIPGLIGVFNMVLIRTYMQDLPTEIWESAEMDGANDIVTFTRIALPLAKPVLAVVTIFNAVGIWNDWYTNFLYAGSNKDLRTLPLVLVNLVRTFTVTQSGADLVMGAQRSISLTPESARAAITMIVSLPIIFIYPLFQKQFTKGIMMGSIKF